MRILKLLSIGWVVILTLVISLYGNEWNKKTILKLTEPMQIEGVHLQPGTYVFKLMDSKSDRHILRIMDQDETHVIATIIGTPHYEFEPPDKTQMDFWEAQAVNPPAVRTWQYPGEMFGLQFTQPPPTQTAAAPPPAVAAIPPASVPAPVPAPEPAPEPEVTPAPAPQPPEVAQAPPAPQEPSTPPVETLPKTGSALPLIALSGLALMAISGVFRMFRGWQA
jgi:LPXTG-motif cell wall-anchored protein